jgi:hypothetical protein
VSSAAVCEAVETQRELRPAGPPSHARQAVGVRGLSEAEARSIYVPRHFINRFRERFPKSNVDPVTLGRGLVWAIANHHRDLYEFIGRDHRIPDRRRYRAMTSDGHHFIAVVDTNSMVPVTVYPPTDDR